MSCAWYSERALVVLYLAATAANIYVARFALQDLVPALAHAAELPHGSPGVSAAKTAAASSILNALFTFIVAAVILHLSRSSASEVDYTRAPKKSKEEQDKTRRNAAAIAVDGLACMGLAIVTSYFAHRWMQVAPGAARDWNASLVERCRALLAVQLVNAVLSTAATVTAIFMAMYAIVNDFRKAWHRSRRAI